MCFPAPKNYLNAKNKKFQLDCYKQIFGEQGEK